MHGGTGNDVIYDRGDDQHDYLNGGDGADVLMGGPGDNLHGGTGADTFSLMQNDASIVEDFAPNEDVIEVIYEGEAPTLSTAQTEAGLALMADGELVATFTNLTELDTKTVSLIAA
jgi:Ca2+-binding RTX toxin-like protein